MRIRSESALLFMKCPPLGGAVRKEQSAPPIDFLGFWATRVARKLDAIGAKKGGLGS